MILFKKISLQHKVNDHGFLSVTGLGRRQGSNYKGPLVPHEICNILQKIVIRALKEDRKKRAKIAD